MTLSRSWSGGIAVLWGGEDGALDRAAGYNHSIEHRGLTVGDLDADGLPEVIVANGIASLEGYRFWPERVEEWLHLDSLGSFEVVEDLALADLDGDGLPDMVAMAYIDYEEWNQMSLYVAYGVEPLRFTEWTRVAAVPALEKGGVEVGDVDGDGDLDLMIRPINRHAAMLVRATGPRTWAEAAPLPGTTALFSPRDPDGRVELITHEGTTGYRHIDGDSDRRVALVTHESLVEGALRQVGEADGDGRYDLVATDAEATYVWLRREDGPVQVQVAGMRLAAVQFPDIDCDDRRDMVGIGNGQVFVRQTRQTASPRQE